MVRARQRIAHGTPINHAIRNNYHSQHTITFSFKVIDSMSVNVCVVLNRHHQWHITSPRWFDSASYMFKKYTLTVCGSFGSILR